MCQGCLSEQRPAHHSRTSPAVAAVTCTTDGPVMTGMTPMCAGVYDHIVRPRSRRRRHRRALLFVPCTQAHCTLFQPSCPTLHSSTLTIALRLLTFSQTVRPPDSISQMMG